VEERILGAVVRELRKGPEPPLAIEGRVLRELASAHSRERATRWVVLAQAAAIALAIGGGIMILRVGPDNSTSTTAPVSAQAHPVTFALEAPANGAVAIVGDFNDWDPRSTPLTRRGGTWQVTLPLQPGRYRYSFVVDGQVWIADPGRPPTVDDDFGTPTSVVTVLN
jgi:hypothetical protein